MVVFVAVGVRCLPDDRAVFTLVFFARDAARVFRPLAFFGAALGVFDFADVFSPTFFAAVFEEVAFLGVTLVVFDLADVFFWDLEALDLRLLDFLAALMGAGR